MQVPPDFRGEWAGSASACGRAGDEARLRVAADRVTFHESAGPVLAVEQHPGREITVRVGLTGEGQARTLARRWRLSPDGATLQDVTEGEGLVRQRCPAARE